MAMLTTEGLGFFTDDEPGIGGILKARPEDFIVEEIAREEFTGSGPYLYLYIQKVRRLTTDVARILSERFGLPWQAIGYAGLKDKHAITRQWFSVEKLTEDQAATFEDSHLTILAMDRHDQPLTRGRLRGNRFRIKVRNVAPSAVLPAKRIIDRLVRTGAPNFIGEQRFGYRHDAHLQGRALLLGNYQFFLDQLLGKPMEPEPLRNAQARREYELGNWAQALELWSTVHRFERQALGALTRGATAEQAINAIDRPHLTLMISAFQSAIFNAVCNDRLRMGLLGTLLQGDVAMKHETGGVFHVRDLAAEQQRADALEISPTGPMWGKALLMPEDGIGDAEVAALRDTGVGPEHLVDGPFVPEGTRRSLRMVLLNARVSAGADDAGPYVEVDFELPRGSFATTVMREVMKQR
jgi:tRNA pseudouridine13 synthase